jgi:hypothetical protein
MNPEPLKISFSRLILSLHPKSYRKGDFSNPYKLTTETFKALARAPRLHNPSRIGFGSSAWKFLFG